MSTCVPFFRCNTPEEPFENSLALEEVVYRHSLIGQMSLVLRTLVRIQAANVVGLTED